MGFFGRFNMGSTAAATQGLLQAHFPQEPGTNTESNTPEWNTYVNDSSTTTKLQKS